MHFFLMQNLMGVGTSGKLSSREVRDPRAFYPEAPSCKHVFHFELGRRGEGSGGVGGVGGVEKPTCSEWLLPELIPITSTPTPRSDFNR